MEVMVGCALGGGGARGLSHIGVLKVLEQHNIHPRVIAGTSIGALVGALYAGGMTAAEIEKVALEVDWRRMARLVDVTLPFHGLLQGKRITSLVRSIIGDPDFSELKLPFACVATDIESGEEMTLTRGSVVDAVRASISVPGILMPVRLDGRYLVDGGLLNQVPVKTCRELGAGYVIGVNVIPEPLSTTAALYNWHISGKTRDNSGKATVVREKKPFFRQRGPNLVKILTQSLIIPGHRLAMMDLAGADLAISPSVGGIGFFQFDKAAEAIAIGEKAARAALEEAGL
jgi:NTE family protein